MLSKRKVSDGLLTSLLTYGLVLVFPVHADTGDYSVSDSIVAQLDRPLDKPDRANRLKERLPANKNLPVSKFLGKEHFQSKLRKDLGADLKSFELMTYQAYIDKYTPGETGVTDISSDRMMAVLEVSFPKGLKADNAEYSTAVVRSVRDAVSGELIEYEITGEVTDKSSLNKVVTP
jgi:hypothetical protein